MNDQELAMWIRKQHNAEPLKKKQEETIRQVGVGSVDISEKEKRYVNMALNENRLSYGRFSRAFENAFANGHNCKHAIFCNSGTSALQIAVAALKEKYSWSDGDEILVPAVTFIASSNVILQNNMIPVFVDVHEKYYNIDPNKIEEKITSRTRAIMVVHLFGQPCDMDPIIEISKKYNLRVIEDSCETMFARYKGKFVGNFSDIACFSTYTAHILVTGVGGFAVTNDTSLAISLRSLMNHGRDSIYMSIDDDDNKNKEELNLIMKSRFKFVTMGYSYRATEMEAALGLGQIELHEEFDKKRKENANYLANGLKKWSHCIQLPETMPDTEHVFMMFPIVINSDKFTRDELTSFLEENNIETRYMMPLLNQPYYIKIFGNIEQKYPVAQKINNNGFYIGSHRCLAKDDLDYVISKFDEFLSRIK